MFLHLSVILFTDILLGRHPFPHQTATTEDGTHPTVMNKGLLRFEFTFKQECIPV